MPEDESLWDKGLRQAPRSGERKSESPLKVAPSGLQPAPDGWRGTPLIERGLVA